MKSTLLSRQFLTPALLLALVVAAWPRVAACQQNMTQWMDRSGAPQGDAYAGPASCTSCHAREAKTYGLTAHAADSSLPNSKTIRGEFDPDKAVLRTRNPNLAFSMTKGEDGFYQNAFDPTNPKQIPFDKRRFDIVIGSGRHGQSYLYWDGDKLFQLPVSYWSYAQRWVNSPSFPDGVLHWDRPIGPRCLECHASYFEWQPPPVNRYRKDSLALSINCERCHGPGAQHVARERSPKPPKSGSPEVAIVNPASLSRDQQLSLCSLCHAGGGPPIKPPMSYVVGADINEYLKIIPPKIDAPVDVHGNQVGALEQSKCFASGKLTCSTCHNVHRVQQNADSFSAKCLTCHKVSSCGLYPAKHEALRGKCVSCHMPLGRSRLVTTANAGHSMQAAMRTHRIAIYPDLATDDKGTADHGR